MSIENKRKTLANCKNSEFLAAAMKARKIVCEYYGKVDVKEISERFKSKYESDSMKPEAIIGLVNDVIGVLFTEYPAETVQIAAIAGFMTEDEAENIAPSELYAILLECALSERVLDFFISVDSSVGKNTGGIYAALILLRVISGAVNTSAKESEQNTNGMTDSLPVGAMSENASDASQEAE